MTHETYQAAPDGIAADELRSFIERIERVSEEIKGLNDDKRDIYAEAKGRGYDVVTIKEIVKQYKTALGMT